MIMLAIPTGFTKDDEEAYNRLSAQTDLMLYPRNVTKDSRPQNTSKRRLLERFRAPTGNGVTVFLPGHTKGITSKLNLLLAEFRAGNTSSTRNEIVSILDELSRRKRISRKEYTEINNFLQQ